MTEVLIEDSEECFICQKPVKSGKDGLMIMKHFICADCEKRLINLPVGDQWYELYKNKIKQIWFS